MNCIDKFNTFQKNQFISFVNSFPENLLLKEIQNDIQEKKFKIDQKFKELKDLNYVKQ